MAAQYNLLLVATSVIVASLASYAALDLTRRISASRGSFARAWLIGGAFAMGLGIWSMHFIGMLAYVSPIPLGYDVSTTLLSLLIAIVASGFALYVASRPSVTWTGLIAAGVVMGLAIVSMHYVGMAAIVLSPPMSHDPPLVSASVAIAVAASIGALAIAFKLRTDSRWSHVMKPASAAIMGLAISGMHYTAMAAVHIAPGAVCLSGSLTDKFWLAGAVTVVTVLILSVTLVLSLIDARMSEKTAYMTASLEHAQEANKAKDEFLAMLGHELRNPLAAISNAVTLLGTEEPRSPSWQFARDVIERQSRHLRRMVDDLLDVGRAVAGNINLNRRPLDLSESAAHAVAAISASGKAARHELTWSGSSVWIDGDSTRIDQVVTNLVNNALSYTPAGGSVTVRVKRDREQAVVSVEDNGAGLRREDVERIFDLFYQAHPDGQRPAGGMGIGLTLVRRLVEMHGGSITASSPGPGKGATFTVRFPAIEAPEHRGALTARGAHAARRTIAVVEDDRDALESLRLLLISRGHMVITARDGVSGLERITSERPEIGIIDIAMPRMNGYDLARQLRARRIPIYLIALTAYGQAEDARRAREAGFDAHVVKPADLEELTSLIAEAACATA